MAAFGPLSFLYPFDDFTFAYPYIFVLLLGWGCLKTFFLRFETAPLSAIFVHRLPRDGIFLKVQNLDFCNFSPHFHPHALPLESPTFLSFQETYFDCDIPTHLLSHSAHQPPLSEGYFWKILREKQGNTFRIQTILELIPAIWEQQSDWFGRISGSFSKNFLRGILVNNRGF